MCIYPVQPICTSLLFILLFIKSQYTVFAHLICFALFILLHILLFISPYICSCVVLLLYNFYLYSFALSTERTWFDYISLLIIPCIIYYVTDKETLTLNLLKRVVVICSSLSNFPSCTLMTFHCKLNIIGLHFTRKCHFSRIQFQIYCNVLLPFLSLFYFLSFLLFSYAYFCYS